MVKWAAKKDNNQNEIQALFIAAGFSVLDMSRLGNGAPDLAVGYNNRNYFFEIKNGNKSLTDREFKFASDWKGNYSILRNTEEALEVIDWIKTKDI